MAIKVPKERPEENIIRVADDFYKEVKKVTAKGDYYKEWVKISRQTIVDDYDRYFIRNIPKYDSFCVYPNHRKHQSVIESNFNRYSPFIHKPKKGSIKWTMRLLRHIFEDQIEIGLDYIKLLYEIPTQILPILCLVSYDNQTGKTTFLDWLSELFKSNVAILGNQDLQSQFNSLYAIRLIMAIDESKIDKQHVLEKIKSLATAKTINVNNKFITPYTVDFFAKIIMCSNHEDNFITARDEDIRYWVRKIGKPKFKNFDIDIDLKNEIPAFVYYLQNRDLKHKKVSRMWFDPEELFTDALGEIKKNSQETVIKHIMEFLTDRFDAAQVDELFANPTDLKNIIFKNNTRVDPSYIRRLLKTRFNLDPSNKVVRYSPLDNESYDYEAKDFVKESKTGKPFKFTREIFYLNCQKTDEKEPKNDQKTVKNSQKEPENDTFLVENENDENIYTPENQTNEIPF